MHKPAWTWQLVTSFSDDFTHPICEGNFTCQESAVFHGQCDWAATFIPRMGLQAPKSTAICHKPTFHVQSVRMFVILSWEHMAPFLTSRMHFNICIILSNRIFVSSRLVQYFTFQDIFGYINNICIIIISWYFSLFIASEWKLYTWILYPTIKALFSHI